MPLESSTVAPPQEKSAPRQGPLKVGFVSLGCPKNLVDSEVMMGLLASGGAEITVKAEDADVIVVNTCSFIDTAKQESVDTILEMAQHKSSGRAKKLIVAGCLVERYRNEIQKNIPEVDAVVGTGELQQILSAAGIQPQQTESSPFVILNSRAEGNARQQSGRFSKEGWDGAIADLPNYLYDENTPRLLATPKYSAYIKIAEGCDHPCSFCIIPQLRGKFRSRRFESVMAEAQHLAAQGVGEITLIGQDTTCYGEDLDLKDGLALLLERLAGIETGLAKWIRFLYCYPNKITQRLLDTLAAHDSLVKYIDMPLQHASAPVLKRMKRGAGGDIFLKLLERIRRTIPGVGIRTSMIVGFPGETDSDFETLCDFVKEARFDRLGVFSYSDEDTSASFRLDSKVDSRTIYNRKRCLMALQRKISRARNRALVGSEHVVLVEGPSADSEMVWEARLPTQAPEIDGVCYISDPGARPLHAGEFRRMRIIKAHDYDLTG